MIIITFDKNEYKDLLTYDPRLWITIFEIGFWSVYGKS